MYLDTEHALENDGALNNKYPRKGRIADFRRHANGQEYALVRGVHLGSNEDRTEKAA